LISPPLPLAGAGAFALGSTFFSSSFLMLAADPRLFDAESAVSGFSYSGVIRSLD